MSLCFLVRAALSALGRVELPRKTVVSETAFNTEFKDTWASQEVRVNVNLVAGQEISPSSFAEGMNHQNLL